ncbi:hypothetical protein [uncultured Photobacterium sp.]|nr:hypothetical protein [uncultured Photobacterium sp.]
MGRLIYIFAKDTQQAQPFDWEEFVEKAIEAIDEFFRQQWD